MAKSILARLREIIEGNRSVRKVADDPTLMAELLLLFRMVLADGEVSPRELETLRRICEGALGIDAEDLGLVLAHLQDYGYETTIGQSIAVFQELDRSRRVDLARHLAAIARSDAELAQHEVRLLARVLELLDLRPNDLN